MLKRLDGEKAVAAHSDEINAGMHNLIRECQRQYNKGRTANPARTAELIQMVDEADKAGCLENPLYSGMKKWVVEQRKWEASEEGKAFKDQQDADRAAKYVGKKAPQRVSAAPVATTAPPRTPQTKAATQVKKPSGRSH
jgi:hypothetical protein